MKINRIGKVECKGHMVRKIKIIPKPFRKNGTVVRHNGPLGRPSFFSFFKMHGIAVQRDIQTEDSLCL